MDIMDSLEDERDCGITPTEQKIIERAMLGHRQIQEGKCKDSEEVFRMLEEGC